mgnify:CR=1 FL=1
MEIEGNCIPEDSYEFFIPLIEWVWNLFQNDAITKSEKFTLNIRCDYYNSASAKMFVYLFDKVAEIQKKGYNLKVTWYCNSLDPDLIESINDYMTVSDVKINIIEV